MNMNIKQFPEITYFLSHQKPVNNLKTGAKQYGGATKIHDKIFSNYEIDDIIRILPENTIGIYIPSTIDVNKSINNRQFVDKYLQKVMTKYPLSDITLESAQGGWISNDGNLILEDITILQINLMQVTVSDLRYFIDIAQNLKNEMRQEGLSLSINDSLAII